jgi:hypothetical protein
MKSFHGRVGWEKRSVEGPTILVGRSRLTDALGVAIPAGVSPDRLDEGFVIVCRGDRPLLAGNNDGPYHGTEYAGPQGVPPMRTSPPTATPTAICHPKA